MLIVVSPIVTEYRVVFRACDEVYALHNRPRPFGLDKRGVIALCFQSLVKAIGRFPHEIIVLGDRLSGETLEFFEDFPVSIVNETLHNDRSIQRSFQIAGTFSDDDWVYLCEDDYFHVPHAFEFIDDFLLNRDSILDTEPGAAPNHALTENLRDLPLFIHPPDYPDRYKPTQRRPSFLFVSRHCHWRQISNTTFTFLAQARTIRTFRPLLDRTVDGADDALLSRLLYASESYEDKALCISPVPGLATHMHDGVLTPLVDWKEMVARIQRRPRRFWRPDRLRHRLSMRRIDRGTD